MRTFDQHNGDLDNTRGKWRPTLKHDTSSLDVDGDPTSWKEMAVISCPNCGSQFGVKVNLAGISGVVTCGYSRPAVMRNERKQFDSRGRLIRIDVREEAPAFACDFSDTIELIGWDTPTVKADFVKRKDDAKADVDKHKDDRLAKKIEDEIIATAKEKAKEEVKARKNK